MIGISVSELATNRLTPIGGVTNPIARLTTIMIPKWIGFMPTAVYDRQKDRCQDQNCRCGIHDHSHDQKEYIDHQKQDDLIGKVRQDPGAYHLWDLHQSQNS